MTVDMENTLAGVSDGTINDTEYLSQITDFVCNVISMYSSVSAEEKGIQSQVSNLIAKSNSPLI